MSEKATGLDRLRGLQPWVGVLPDRLRVVVEMKLRGVSRSDIGRNLGLSPMAVSVRLSNAASAMERARDGTADEPDDEESPGVDEKLPGCTEIARQMGISKARVQQLEARALRKLRDMPFARELASQFGYGGGR